MQPEIIALLFPEPAQAAEGAMAVRHLEADGNLMSRAMLTGRFNSGKPIVDPVTREVIGYEIEPLAAAC
jgi:hypothetical protein